MGKITSGGGGLRRGGVVAMDAATGEVLEQVPVVFSARHQNGFERFLTMNMSAVSKIARDRELRGEAKSVFLELISRVDFENYLAVNQAEIAKAMGMQRPHVNRSIRALVAKGIFLEGPKVGRCKTYRLNPNYGWRGTGKNHQEALKEHNFRVIQGGKQTDAEVRAELEAKGQTRLEFAE